MLLRKSAVFLLMLAASASAQSTATRSAGAEASSPTTRDRPAATPPPPQASKDDNGTAAAYQRAGGSLLRAGRSGAVVPGDSNGSQVDPRVADMSFFAVPPPPRRVIQPHDLITIIIKEQSEFKSEGTSKLDKKASLEAAINEFITLNLNSKSLEPLVGATKPKIDLEGTSSFSGKGSAERKDSLSVRMQAEVVDVKPNGNLVLQARRRIKTDDEVRVYLVSGIVRVTDVSTDNSVLSTQMYDFDLNQDSKGTVREATRRGWLPRLLDALNPF